MFRLAFVLSLVALIHSYNPSSPVRRANGLYLNSESVLGGDVNTNLPINEFDNFNREVPTLSR